MAPALRELLLSESEQFGKVPIDFRSLSVREFGTIYEGLLESELSIAEENLTINKQGTFIPAKTDDHIEIKKGEICLRQFENTKVSEVFILLILLLSICLMNH